MQRLHVNTAWKSYDKSFRKLTESLELAWQKAVEELRGKFVSMSKKQNYGQPFLGKTASKALFCFTFKQGECKNTPCPHALTLIHAKYVAVNTQKLNVLPQPTNSWYKKSQTSKVGQTR